MATDTTERVTEVKFIYNKPENYNPQFINGVIGGLTTRGEIILNFFFEHSDIPKEETNIINADGFPERKVPRAEIPEVLRDIKVGIIVSPSIAGSIYEFLKSVLTENNEREKLMAEAKALNKEAEDTGVEKGAQ